MNQESSLEKAHLHKVGTGWRIPIEGEELSTQRTKCARARGCTRTTVKNDGSFLASWRIWGNTELGIGQSASKHILPSYYEKRRQESQEGQTVETELKERCEEVNKDTAREEVWGVKTKEKEKEYIKKAGERKGRRRSTDSDRHNQSTHRTQEVWGIHLLE